ncbi:MAG: nicotinate phosphoribosyltransferase [Planctomycetales bacterium]
MTEPFDDPLRSALFTDLYELTMAQAYDAEGFDGIAHFELFFRSLPPNRNFVMAAGLDDVLAYLEALRFTESDIDYLRRQRKFADDFLDRLRDVRFTGDVDAVPEGTLVFPDEPLVRVSAPILAAQLVETFVLNQVNFQSIAATKAARVMLAARGRTVVDFGSRRAHGADAALKVARASWLAGAAGTSNVLAGKRYGIPTFGTMAHSYIQAHDDEFRAFEVFARQFPETTLLVDTFDTLDGVRRVIALRDRLGDDFRVQAVRLDSGDLARLAKASRKLLDEAGLRSVRIFASSGLDEYRIARLLDAGAPIDGFGVGTGLAVSDDAPALDTAYKLVEYAGRPRTKLSAEKVLHPGRKQVFRTVRDGLLAGDTIGRFDEDLPGELLLVPMMRGGQRLPAGRVPLAEVRERARRELEQLPEPLRALESAREPYPVEFSAELERELEALRRERGVSPPSPPGSGSQ